MESFHTGLLCLLILLISDNQVAAQEGPSIVIAHPGQNVELSCTVTTTSGDQAAAWLINNSMGPYRIGAIRGGILAGYTGRLGSHNLIVENITMNDDRNGSEYRCVIVPAVGMVSLVDIAEESDPIILHVAVATGVPVMVPAMVPGVTIVDNSININENNVTLTLSWGEPFNNLDPIVSYTVSCSGDDTCPPNFTTTGNTTRSYTITNLTLMTNYTFSVVATNSIGSGEAGVVMITTPGRLITSTSSMDMTTMSSMSMASTVTTIIATTSSVNMTTSSVDMTTSSVDMTLSDNSVPTTSVIPTTPTTTTASNATPASNTGDDDGGGSTVIIVVIVIIVLLVVYCCMVLLFFYCYNRKEINYQNKDDHHDRIIHASIIVLGILTCGTSYLLWWLWSRLARLCCDNHSGEKRLSNEYDEVPDNSVRNSVAYTASPQTPVKEKDITATKTDTAPADTKGQELQYDYAATGISKVT